MIKINFSEISIYSKQISEELKHIRRSLHRIPELGFEEVETSLFIENYLKNNIGISVENGIAGTGITAVLEGALPGPTIALRSDIDALPIKEQTGLDYASNKANHMHACGHDGHMAITLGAAKILKKFQYSLPGKVKFIFQPAEELALGAARMIEDGVLENPKVDAVLGFHLWPELPKGKLAVKSGAIMAAGDKFELKIIGKGGHGAEPHNTVDPIVISAEIITALQTIVSRETDPRDIAIVTIGTLSAGSAFNIIPGEVTITGTVRTVNTYTQERISKTMERIVSGITKANKADFTLKYEKIYPLTFNSKNIAEFIYETVKDTEGDERALWLPYSGLASEDFSKYLMKVPGTYFFIGAGEVENFTPLHNPKFSFDENIISQGAASTANIILNILKHPELI